MCLGPRYPAAHLLDVGRFRLQQRPKPMQRLLHRVHEGLFGLTIPILTAKLLAHPVIYIPAVLSATLVRKILKSVS